MSPHFSERVTKYLFISHKYCIYFCKWTRLILNTVFTSTLCIFVFTRPIYIVHSVLLFCLKGGIQIEVHVQISYISEQDTTRVD